MRQRRARHHEILFAVRHPAMILAPRHFRGVGGKVLPADVVVNADLSAAQARKEAFGHVGAGLPIRVRVLMVDALCEIERMQAIPVHSLIGVDGRAGVNGRLDMRHGSGLRLGNVREGAAIAFTHHNHDAALAILVDRKATVATVLFPVGGLHVTAEVRAVHFNRTGRLNLGDFRRHGLTQLVRQNESRFVSAAQVTGELQGAMALRAVHEDRDGQQNVADGHLAAGEDRAARDAKLMTAALALPELAGGDLVALDAAAAGANRFPARVAPADHAEGGMGFLVRHARDLRQIERAGGGGKEEVLSHLDTNDFRWHQ